MALFVFLIPKLLYKDLVAVAKDTETNEIKCHTIAFRIDSIDDFKLYLQEAGLKITHTFGNYKLNEFNKNSERLIIIAKKVE